MRLALIALLTTAAFAGAASAQPACSGQWAVIRVNKIKAGQMPLFRKAVKDQQAWYRAHGVANNQQKIGQVLSQDGGFAADEVVTVHMNSPMEQQPRDAGWDGFVKEFRDSSDLVTEKRVCLVDPA